MKSLTIIGVIASLGLIASPAIGQSTDMANNSMTPMSTTSTTTPMSTTNTTSPMHGTTHKTAHMTGMRHHMTHSQMMKWCNSMSHKHMMRHSQCRTMMSHHHQMMHHHHMAMAKKPS